MAIEITSYRAAYFQHSQGATCMTRAEQAGLSDDELIEATVKEARDHGLIGDAPHQFDEDDFRGALTIA